jgi:DNA polymerase-3 subunit beta
MNIKINRESLLKPLSAVASIVEKRHTLPILSNLLVEVKKNQMLLTATDLEMQISLAIEHAATESFSTTIAAKKLLDICRSLPDDSEINMTTNENRILLKAGKSRFNLQTLPSEDYPVLSKSSGENTIIRLGQLEFKTLLKKVEFAMAQQDIRYYLNGLLLEVSGDQLKLVGTDGHRLSYTSTTLGNEYEKQEIILPRKTVIELIKLLDDSDEEIEINLSKSQINFSFGPIKLISKVIDGKFPDYNRVIPTGHHNTFTIDRMGVLLAMQRASILSNEKYRGIRMVINRNSLKLISTNSDQEEAEEDIEILYAGDVLDIGFNVTYLIEVLNNASEENITFAFSDASSSCLITLPNNQEYKYVVMPMRI